MGNGSQGGTLIGNNSGPFYVTAPTLPTNGASASGISWTLTNSQLQNAQSEIDAQKWQEAQEYADEYKKKQQSLDKFALLTHPLYISSPVTH